MNLRLIANWMLGDLSAAMNREALDINQCPIKPNALGGLIQRVVDNTLSSKLAKQVFEALWNQEGDAADDIIENRSLKQVSDITVLSSLIDEVVANNSAQVEQYPALQIK